MITNKVEEARNWDYTDYLSCENCGRTENLHRIFVKNGIKCKEFCFCDSCCHEIFAKVWPFGEGRRSK